MMRKRAVLLLILALISLAAPAYSSQSITHGQKGLSKQSFELNQIMPRATRQEYGNVTVYSTVGQVDQNTLTRWSPVSDLWAYIFVQRQKWLAVNNLPRDFTVVLVTENEFRQFWPQATADTAGVFIYPKEIWLVGLNTNVTYVIHEFLHRVLSWIYKLDYSFQNTRLPGYNPLIIEGGEILANQLNKEMGFHLNPMVFAPNRFNRMWGMAKELMRGQEFIGVENVETPRVLDCRPGQGCAWQELDINIFVYKAWQKYNGTGETYLGIIMLANILYHYDKHEDNTGIFDLAVCNAKKLFNQYMGRIPGENFSIIFQGQFIDCE